jgi:AraC family transcriptional regulator, regulatory protein of adaptative response / methylated-DNA-[protein]-cysteine methyltransferase
MSSSAFVDSRDFVRIARAIRYIEENFRAQPRLATLAAAARLSEFHFNRLFRRWAGVTPRQYLAIVTADAARAALPDSPSVLDTAYTLGLSGPGRLHDLLVTLDGVTPGELKTGGQGMHLTYGFSDTPFGRALLANTPRGLSHLSFLEPGAEQAALMTLATGWPNARRSRDDAAAGELAHRIWTSSGATARRTPIQLAVRGTNFQLKVWQALLELGTRGSTSYGALARAAGCEGAARAVGGAVGANPVAWLIPCHNVLRQDGGLGGYRWGVERKRAMRVWEWLQSARATRPVAEKRDGSALRQQGT